MKICRGVDSINSNIIRIFSFPPHFSFLLHPFWRNAHASSVLSCARLWKPTNNLQNIRRRKSCKMNFLLVCLGGNWDVFVNILYQRNLDNWKLNLKTTIPMLFILTFLYLKEIMFFVSQTLIVVDGFRFVFKI